MFHLCEERCKEAYFEAPPPPGRGRVYSPTVSVSGIFSQYRQLGEKGTSAMHM